MNTPKPVISDEYKNLNRQLHEDRPDYGALGHAGGPMVLAICQKKNFTTVLDYGCGKGTLKPYVAAAAPHIEVLEFDPAIEGKDTLPTQPVDLIAAIDVMEHIEPDYLTSVLQTMRDLRPQMVFLAIATTPANKTLADGRNAHLIVEPPAWWLEQLQPYFKTLDAQEMKSKHLMYRGAPL